MTAKNPHAQALRAIPSERRAEASRENGRRYGGRPTKLAVLIRDAAEIRIGGEIYTGRRTVEALRQRMTFEAGGTTVLVDGEDVTRRIGR